jgi:Ubiquitin-activating enzyme E1 FCCH domain
MPSLLSGKTLRSGGSDTFINLKGAQPQFPPDADQTTGYTISTNNLSISTTTNTLGNLVHYKGEIYSNLPNGNITFTGTGTGTVIVSQPTIALGTNSGALVVHGGIGVGGNMVIADDIVVNGITVGQGFQGINNISLTGPMPTDPTDDFNDGQESISIGWGSLQNISSSNRSIAIGVNALSSGTGLRSNIAVGDTALSSVGVLPSFLLLPIVTATNAVPAVLTVNNHNYTTGTEVIINDAQGMDELNSTVFWVNVVDTSTVQLYSDNILSTPVDSTSFGAYIGGGIINRVLLTDNNIGIGTNAGKSLYDGNQNLFIGDNVATNITTGTSNFIFGHDSANNLITGNRNISIMGDNLIDGEDDQISIGAIFYYNGQQFLDLNTDVAFGIGTESTDTNSGSLLVQGGGAVQLSLNVGQNLTVAGTGTVTLTPISSGTVNIFPSPTPGDMNNMVIGDVQPRDGTFLNLRGNAIYGLSTSNAISTLTGAVQIAGGVGIQRDVWIGGVLHVNQINGAVNTSSVATNLSGGAPGSVPYQSNTSTTAMLPLGTSTWVLASNGTQPIWVDPLTLPATSSTNALELYIHQVSSNTNYYIGLSETINSYSAIDSTSSFAYNTTQGTLTVPNISVTNTSTATSLTTGAVQVAGGIGAKNLYSDSGIRVKGLSSANLIVFSDSQGNLTNNGSLSYNTSTAVLTGSITTATNLAGGLAGSVPYQTAPGRTSLLPIGTIDQVLISNGSIPQWVNLASIAASTSTNSDNVYVQLTKEDLGAGGPFYVTMNSSYDAYTKLSNTTTFVWDDTLNSVKLQSFTTATSTTTGALIVTGGVGVMGDIYSASGNSNEGYKLYVPITTISIGVPPTNPRLGDFWIDPSYGVTFQYILDGADRIWFQFTGL